MQAAVERASLWISTCRSLEVLHLQNNPKLVPVEECKERPAGFHALMNDVVHNARLRVLSLSAAMQACPAASLAKTCARASFMCRNHQKTCCEPLSDVTVTTLKC